MRGISISENDAKAVAQILREDCGWFADDRDEWEFVHHVTKGCDEYRFIGALGFGGKFRNNGNRDDTPYVDFYPEDATPERERRALRANKKLAELFRRQGERTHEHSDKDSG
jgi:hypothetical protein